MRLTVEEKESAWQALDGSDEQLGERLAAALGLALRDLEKGVKARLGLVAVVYGVLGLLVEVHERRIGLEQRVRLRIQNQRR